MSITDKYSFSGKFKKAKAGDLFMESVGTSIETSPKPRLLVFQGLVEREAPRWAGEPDKLFKQGFVHFKIALTGEDLFVHGDDVYGKYPRLDVSQEQKLRQRLEDLEAQVATYNHILGELVAYQS